MRIAYLLFNGITWLDFIGVYDPLVRLKAMNVVPGLNWDVCAFTGTVADNAGLEIKPVKIKQSLAGYTAIVVPGGMGTRQLRHDAEFINWVKTADDAALKISVCTGSLILGAAGFLEGKRATTNFREYETLAPYCKEVVRQRIVEDGNVITAGAVASSLDLGLYLCEKWAGKAVRDEIKKQMDYNG